MIYDIVDTRVSEYNDVYICRYKQLDVDTNRWLLDVEVIEHLPNRIRRRHVSKEFTGYPWDKVPSDEEIDAERFCEDLIQDALEGVNYRREHWEEKHRLEREADRVWEEQLRMNRVRQFQDETPVKRW